MKLQYKKYMIFLLWIDILTFGDSMIVNSYICFSYYDCINFLMSDFLIISTHFVS